jgi:hypothetical protein
MEKNMNNKLKIILIIGVVVLLCGVGVGAAGYAMGGMKGVILQAGGPQVIDESNNAEIEKVDETFENITDIEVDLDGIESVTIKEGPSLSVKGQHFLYFGGLKAERAANGTLFVTHSVKGVNLPWLIDFPSILRSAINPYPTSYLEITAPRGTSLSAIAVNVAFGNVTIDAATVERAEIKVDSGNISASNLTCGSFNTEASFGDIDIQNTTSDDVSIASDSGNIKLWNLTAPGGVTIKSSYGNVDLEAVNAGASKLELSSGDLSARGISIANGMTLRNSFGNIAITGSLRGNSTIESNSGNLDLALNGTEDDYSISGKSNVGEIRIGDRAFIEYGNGRFESGPSSAPNRVSIQSDFGDVDVEFRN